MADHETLAADDERTAVEPETGADQVTDDQASIKIELAVLSESCVNETLPQYLETLETPHPSAHELLAAVKKLINGKKIPEDTLTFLRAHISPYINFTKQRERSLTIPAGEGIGEAAKATRSAIRRIVGKVDPLNWLDQALKDRVEGLDLGALITRRLEDINAFLQEFGFNENQCAQIQKALTEKMRELCHDMVQGSYDEFELLAEKMKELKVTSLGIDFSDALVQQWHPSKQELAILLEKDLQEAPPFWRGGEQWDREKFLDAVYTGKAHPQQIRNVIMLAAMRKSGFDHTIMKPVSTNVLTGGNSPTQQPISSEVFLYDKKSPGIVDRPKFSPNGTPNMRNFSEWATNAIARTRRGLELPDNMSANAPTDERADYQPAFYDRIIVPLKNR